MCLILAVPGLAFGAENDAPPRVHAELQGVAGPDAAACGEVPLRQKRTEAAACARRAMKSGKPFWVAFQVQGNDSLLWEGAAGDGRGGYWMILHDSDITGGSGGESAYWLWKCKKLRFKRFSDSVVICHEAPAET